MEHLLARLEVDSRPVSRRIAGLLFNSFVPVDLPEVVWCERCVTLIQMNPVAARKFYQFAHMYTAPTNIGEALTSPLPPGSKAAIKCPRRAFAYF